MNDVKNNLSSVLWHLKNRRNMYVFGEGYHFLVTFWIGYLVSAKDFAKIDIDKLFQDWFQERLSKHFAVHWSSYLLQFHCNQDETKASNIFFEVWEDFLANSLFEG